MWSRDVLAALALSVGVTAGCADAAEPATQAAATQRDHAAATATASFAIEGMACQRCAARIEGIVGQLTGVARVEVDFAAERMKVDYRPKEVDGARIIAEIERAGFDATEVEP